MGVDRKNSAPKKLWPATIDECKALIMLLASKITTPASREELRDIGKSLTDIRDLSAHIRLLLSKTLSAAKEGKAPVAKSKKAVAAMPAKAKKAPAPAPRLARAVSVAHHRPEAKIEVKTDEEDESDEEVADYSHAKLSDAAHAAIAATPVPAAAAAAAAVVSPPAAKSQSWASQIIGSK